MSSFPVPNGHAVSPEVWAFFQVEQRNAISMRIDDQLEETPVQTLGTAHESLCQAPPDVLAAWFTPDGEDESWPTHPLIEFGGLLSFYGDDARLDDFTCQEA